MRTCRRGRAGVLAAGVVVAVVLGAVPAGAESSAGESGAVECEGTLTGELVGDVVVRGSSGRCVIERAVVTGDVVVSGDDDFYAEVVFRRSAVRGDLVLLEAAEASLQSSTVKGDIRTKGFLTRLYLYRSSVYGGVLVDSPFGDVSMSDSTVRHSVRGVAMHFRLLRAKIEGALTVQGGHAGNFDEGDVLWLELSEVGGWATARTLNAYVHGSTFHKGLTLLGNHITRVCGSSVAGDLTLRGSTPKWWQENESYGVGLLGIDEPQNYRLCAPHSPGGHVPPEVVVGGATRIVNNKVPVNIGRVTTRSLECRGNTESLVVGPDVVASERSGQCA